MEVEGRCFAQVKLIRICSAPSNYRLPPQSALDIFQICTSRSKMQRTQRQHTDHNSKHRRLRRTVRRHTPRTLIFPTRTRLVRRARLLITATQTKYPIAAVVVPETVREIAKRISGVHIAPESTTVLNKHRAVSELGTADLHAGVPLGVGWLVLVDFACGLNVGFWVRMHTHLVSDTSLHRGPMAPGYRCN